MRILCKSTVDSTAKATHSEQAQAPHHKLDIRDVTTKSITVVDCKSTAKCRSNASNNRWRNKLLCRKFVIESVGVTATEYSMFRFKRCKDDDVSSHSYVQ